MKTKKIIFIILGILVLGFAFWYFDIREKEQVVELETENPKMGYISENVTATGRIEPVDTVTVGSQVSGTISHIYADFNSKVKKGQLLTELDKTLFQAAVDQYKGTLASAQSLVVLQKANFYRQSELYKVGAISKVDYDTALYNYNSAVENANSTKAQLDAALKNLALASIYSPIDGTVLSRSISEGQTVAASFNTPTLYTIAKDLTKMQVEAAVDEADVGDLKIGERATFTVDAFLDDTFKGSIQEIRLRPSITSNVVTYTTIIKTDNSDQKLKPGMTANITILAKEVNNALLVPAKALKFMPDTTLKKYQLVWINKARKPTSPVEGYVWIKTGDYKLEQKKIEVGINNNTQVEVLGGITKNDIVVVGSRIVGRAAAASAAASSPFMPKRPGSSNNKPR
ncbi:MAG: efflux RND transporter periplasmic adaptor subunit [Candidatus Pedobacter colombiensis]|uniref:Efflux RND transporter periplasmic adaptor subunit n=1 Tax=Candidatus Pedobacter colombiensis TaxID=3121371 RepID=A0AAJ5W6W8_9SPHI|nr:efflux RND transporter periplasmic adaptor subunit [Pedobacter sp.]WEK18238.1 MAG: efflux RND transporter periplasmic adaptor subunit [Pedobacter sp.]